VALRDDLAERVDNSGLNTPARRVIAFLGFRNTDVALLKMYNRAIEMIDELDRDDGLSFKDFAFYDTKLESRWPWMRNKSLAAFLIIGSFYILTPVLFCAVINDLQVCPVDPTEHNRWYYGWLTSIYFASTTMATVG
jgi:hypothetical protein